MSYYKPKLLDKLVAIPEYLKLLKKYNTLEGEYENLKSIIQDGLLKKYLEEINIPEYTKKLEEENEILREKLKKYKEKN